MSEGGKVTSVNVRTYGHIAVAGNVVYANTLEGLTVFDITQPISLRRIGSFAPDIGANAFSISGGYVYGGGWGLPFWIARVQCELPTSVETPAPPHTMQLWSFPNPFNPSTTISYETPRLARVELAIHTVTGERVVVLVDEMQSAGLHRVEWNARNEAGAPLPSGVYFAVLEVDGVTQSQKMALLK